jgi:hypothetical protein
LLELGFAEASELQRYCEASPNDAISGAGLDGISKGYITCNILLLSLEINRTIHSWKGCPFSHSNDYAGRAEYAASARAIQPLVLHYFGKSLPILPANC